MLVNSLTQYIRIEKKVQTVDINGSVVYTWVLYKNTKADFKPSIGSKRTVNNIQDVNFYTSIVYIRYFEGLDYNCRIIYNNQIHEILAIEEMQRKQGYKILVQREENNG